jgi:hypothetical protein
VPFLDILGLTTDASGEHSIKICSSSW